MAALVIAPLGPSAPATCVGVGSYPVALEGVVEKAVCFPGTNEGWMAPHMDTCFNHVVVGVVRCEDFLLFRLPYTGPYNENKGYCTASSGL